jgi:hypothetical protein
MKSEHGVKIDDSPTPCSPNLSWAGFCSGICEDEQETEW